MSKATTTERNVSDAAEAAGAEGTAVKPKTTAKAGKGDLMMTYDKWMQLSKESVEAMMASSKIATAGWEKMAQEFLAFVKTQTEAGVEASKAAFACKTPVEFVGWQSDQIRKAFSTFASEGAKLSEISTQAFSEAVAPLAEKVGEGFDIWKQAA